MAAVCKVSAATDLVERSLSKDVRENTDTRLKTFKYQYYKRKREEVNYGNG
jgi:hypothetical protein